MSQVTLAERVVHSGTPENIARIISALQQMHASYRDLTGRHLPPNPSLLASKPGHNLFATDFGGVDVLATVGFGLTYEDLLADSVVVQLGTFEVRTITLPVLIQLKEQAGRPKDLAESLRRKP